MRDRGAVKGKKSAETARFIISILLVCAFFCVLLAPAKTLFACTDLPVRIADSTPSCYSSLQEAYNAASDGAVIQSKNTTLYGNLNINRNITITLQGGYNSDYSAVSGFTYVKGNITTSASAGPATAGNFHITDGPLIVITSPKPGLTNNTTAQLIYTVNDGAVKVYINNNEVSKVSGDTLGPLIPDGSYVVRVDSTDSQGTVGTASVSMTVDTTPPSAGFTINNGVGYTNSTSVTLNVSATDANGVLMQFSNDNSNWSPMTAYIPTMSWTLPSGDGAKTVYAKFKDNAGNSYPVYPAQSISTITLDTIIPSTTVTPQGGLFNTAVTVNLTTSETAAIHYTTDGTSPTASSPIYSGPIDLVSNATTTIKFFARDAAGNSETVKTAVYTVDTMAPTGTITINNHAKLTNKATVILNLSAMDFTGVSEMQFSNDNNSWSTLPYATSASWTLTSGNGPKTVYAKFKDTAGNWSVQEVATIYLSDPLKKMQAGLTQIAAGSFHNFYLSRDGVLEGWGQNLYGEVGDGTTENKLGPVRIMTAPTPTWVGLSVGIHHSIGLKSDGSLWGWGLNNRYQLTQMINNDQFTPATIGSDTDWIFASAGMNHSMGIKINGTLWGWGDNPAGQVGNNTEETQRTPVRIGTDTDQWVLVSAGWSHTAAIKSGGTLWTWGDNRKGQLGDGSGQQKLSPVKVGTDTDQWVLASAGGYHTAAIKSDGTLWTWGYNSNYGQLGDGTQIDQRSPVKIGTASDQWVTVSAGLHHTAAIKSDGTLWTWGDNSSGQLGDGIIGTQRTTPFMVDSTTDWVDVDSGYYHTMALKSDGSVWTWGLNSSGQVGDGTLITKITPTLILSGSSSSSANDPDAFNVYCNGTEKYIAGESTFTSGMVLPPAGSNGILIDSPVDGSTISGSKTIIKGSIDTLIPVNKVVVEVISNGSGTSSYVAQVNGNYFAAKIALADGANTITAISYDKNGGQHQAAVSVNAILQLDSVSLVATPGSGVPILLQNGTSALDAALETTPSIGNTVASYTWDFVGSGSDQLKCFTHSKVEVEYQQTGLYLARVTVTDTSDNTYTDTEIINVLDYEVMNAFFTSRWNEMTNLLVTGNITGALNYFSQESKDVYNEQFNALSSYLNQIFGSNSSFRLVTMKDRIAEGDLRLIQDGETYSFHVLLTRDDDGNWGITSF